jgi:hypothetical protein
VMVVSAEASVMGQSCRRCQMSCANLRRTSKAIAPWPTCWTVLWTGLSCSALRHKYPKVRLWGRPLHACCPRGCHHWSGANPCGRAQTPMAPISSLCLLAPQALFSALPAPIWLWPRLCGDGRSVKP